MTSATLETESPARSTARELRHQAKSHQILEAAAEVFLEDGFAATSIDKIVERAGVSKRTIYNRYRSKEQIFIDIMKMHFQTLFETFDISPRTGGTLEENLDGLGILLLEMSNMPGVIALLRNISGESQRFPELAGEFIDNLAEQILSIVRGTLQYEIDRGSIRIGNIRQAANYYLNLLTGNSYNRVVFGTFAAMNAEQIRHFAHRATTYFLVTYRAAEVDLLDSLSDMPGDCQSI